MLAKPLLFARTVLETYLIPGDVAIDATCGRGRDTVVMAELVGDRGKVYAIDIQPEAIVSTKRLLEEEGLLERVHLLTGDHSDIMMWIPAEDRNRVRAVCFNLGYLPAGDKKIITKAESTVSALKQSVDMILPDGVVTIMMYPGHDGGDAEALAVREYVATLDQKQFVVYGYSTLNQKNSPASLIVIHRLNN
jgi:SAM-dependent methyltransferase